MMMMMMVVVVVVTSQELYHQNHQDVSVRGAVNNDGMATDHNRADVTRSSDNLCLPQSSTSRDTVAGNGYYRIIDKLCISLAMQRAICSTVLGCWRSPTYGSHDPAKFWTKNRFKMAMRNQ